MWKSPKLRGKGADWQMVGPVFTSAGTVLGNGTHLAKEFVTIDFLGSVAGDPKAGQGLGTRFFLNNVGGNGGGDGCCSGTTSYFVLEQSAPGAPMEAVKGVGTDGQLMLDWGSFQLKPQAEAQAQAQPAGVGLEPEVAKHGPGHLTGLGLLDGSASRGLSMARTLGSEEADQVTQPGPSTTVYMPYPPRVLLRPDCPDCPALARSTCQWCLEHSQQQPSSGRVLASSWA